MFTLIHASSAQRMKNHENAS